MLRLILDSVKLKHRRAPALSKRKLGLAGTRNAYALSDVAGELQADIRTESAERQGYLLDMSNNQQIRY
jgi:hypothetical protein